MPSPELEKVKESKTESIQTKSSIFSTTSRMAEHHPVRTNLADQTRLTSVQHKVRTHLGVVASIAVQRVLCNGQFLIPVVHFVVAQLLHAIK